MVGSQLHGADVDLNEVGKEVRRKGADLLGPSSGPHECLTVRANLANDLANLRLETHVQHAISLVENQVGLASLEHVDETSGGCDADLDTAGEVADLRTLGNTTVDAGVANAGRLAELGNLLLNLDRELTGGSEDQDNRAVAGGQQRLGVDVNNGGQAVGEGLSGTRLGNTDNVATGKSHGPALGLNGGRSREALGLDLVHDISGESSLVEGLDGLGDIVASNGDLVLATEGLDLSRAAVGDLLVLLVERLLEFGHRVEVCLMPYEPDRQDLGMESIECLPVVTTTAVAAIATTSVIAIATTTVASTTSVAAAAAATTATVSAAVQRARECLIVVIFAGAKY
ncbi:hypothetical protein ColLi_03810 [Colletotrichum liriopes]|uniref:Uncharacterized protein n=1 Tax=Colletotrichum liriopes TaxID=708192 RepID=A0AA37GHC1_9PEZI|nr:hypothetical protein ColLi_03810 [Colletotrichum liriopes]